jgi:NAD(P)-dependent dehydrogenase (short-subunit alcohol dehydrogenase family)
VVNDLARTADGGSAAEAVVAEIEHAGGRAVANTDSVASREGGEAVVGTALDTWGRVDVVVSNAGVLRDRSFAKLSVEELDLVLDVHLRGSVFVTQPAFRWMKDNGGGSLLLTTSAAGLFGSFGQANYGAAKMGLVGLMRTLALEGARSGIRANCVAPMAATQLTTAVAEDMADMPPESVSAFVVALSDPTCPLSGETFLAGANAFGRVWTALGPGWRSSGVPSAEDVAEHWTEILDDSSHLRPADAFGVMPWITASQADRV